MQSKLQCKETTVLALNNVYIIYIYIYRTKKLQIPEIVFASFWLKFGAFVRRFASQEHCHFQCFCVLRVVATCKRPNNFK